MIKGFVYGLLVGVIYEVVCFVGWFSSRWFYFSFHTNGIDNVTLISMLWGLPFLILGFPFINTIPYAWPPVFKDLIEASFLGVVLVLALFGFAGLLFGLRKSRLTI